LKFPLVNASLENFQLALSPTYAVEIGVFHMLTLVIPVHRVFQSVVDITIYYNGFHGDLNETYFVGEVDEESKQLVKVTYECINQAIAAGTLT